MLKFFGVIGGLILPVLFGALLFLIHPIFGAVWIACCVVAVIYALKSDS